MSARLATYVLPLADPLRDRYSEILDYHNAEAANVGHIEGQQHQQFIIQ